MAGTSGDTEHRCRAQGRKGEVSLWYHAWKLSPSLLQALIEACGRGHAVASVCLAREGACVEPVRPRAPGLNYDLFAVRSCWLCKWIQFVIPHPCFRTWSEI